VAHTVPERGHGLATERPPRGVGDGATDDQWQAISEFIPECFHREDGSLGVERVEDGLDRDDVGAAGRQPSSSLEIGLCELLERDVAGTRVVDVRGE